MLISWLIPFWCPPEGHRCHDPRRLRWLAGALRSIQAQVPEREYEIILVDDGSPPSIVDQIEALTDLDHRIRLVRNSHHGVAGTLNVGLQHCQGEWIARLDSDDEATADRLERQTTLQPMADVCGGQMD